MKSIFKKLLLAVMVFVLAFSTVACSNNESVEDVAPNEGFAQPEDDNPIVAVDGVDVSTVLSVLNPVLSNEYVTIKMSLDGRGGESSKNYKSSVNLEIDATVHIKNTGSGYDFIAFLEISQKSESWLVSEPAKSKYEHEQKAEIYYIDGVFVEGYSSDGSEMSWYKQEVGTINSLISSLNRQIAYDADLRERYDVIMPVVSGIVESINEMELMSKPVSEELDVKKKIDEVASYVIKNANVDMYTWVMSELLGVEVGNATEIKQAEDEIKAIAEGNPTMAQVLDRLNDYVNAKCGKEIDFETVIDDIQDLLGLTTEEIISMINHNIIYNDEDFLPTPEKGVSAYDYLYSYLSTFRVSDVLDRMGYVSFDDWYADLKSGLKSETFGSFINMVMGETFGYKKQQYVGYGNGDYSYLPVYTYVGAGNGGYMYINEDYYGNNYEYVGEGRGEYDCTYELMYVGYGNGDYLCNGRDYVQELQDFMKEVAFNKANIKVDYTPDSYGRPKSIKVNEDISFDTMYDMSDISKCNGRAEVEISFTYAKPSVRFAIPSKALEYIANNTTNNVGGYL